MSPATVDVATLKEWLASTNPPRLIDVRTPAEFETQHINGAYNVPLDLLHEHRDDIAGHPDQRVVLICRSGQRAAKAAQRLRTAGLGNLCILDGGVSAWEVRGFAVNRGRQRWDLERQVRLIAGLLVATSVLLSAFFSGIEWAAFAVGVGLTTAALTNTCAMGMLLARLPYNRAALSATQRRSPIDCQMLRANGPDRRRRTLPAGMPPQAAPLIPHAGYPLG
ncbi:rhodanese-like domain-containing protein [Mycolicibacterium sp. BiH015]|nr:rhodanese-like domain-containing protein [Mycolicibacterium sp. BiH015]MDA2894335.1 rhodanese-like domain-containing protein [Mycolicibacterium sp. BiH015]